MNNDEAPPNVDPLRPLAGKKALVSGAGRGIGAAIAIALAKAGAEVAVNDLNHPAETVEACMKHGVRSIPAVADVGDYAAIQKTVNSVCEELGGLDIMVSNAAFSDRQLFYQADMAGFEKTIQVCMWGPFYLAREAARRMIAQGTGGNMVFIGSPHAYTAYPGAMAYNMAKAALDQMARTAAVELAEHRIRVNIVHPGWTDTPGERKFFFEEELLRRGAALPLGRLAAPEDIANGVSFLCNPNSSYITGATLSIDGGIVLPYQEMFRVNGRPDESTAN
ncbi:MAG: SDR family oxidoreductase [Pirellulaceae bacterium]|nr:SDR family oxidoreductase [Pirellulaceae bacterium]